MRADASHDNFLRKLSLPILYHVPLPLHNVLFRTRFQYRRQSKESALQAHFHYDLIMVRIDSTYKRKTQSKTPIRAALCFEATSNHNLWNFP